MSHAACLVIVPGSVEVEGVEAAVEHEMAPFDENGDFFKNGSRWDWWQVGGRYTGFLGDSNIVRRRDLDLGKLADERRRVRIEEWHKAQAEAHIGARAILHGVRGAESLEDYMRRFEPHLQPIIPVHYSFLRAR